MHVNMLAWKANYCVRCPPSIAFLRFDSLIKMHACAIRLPQAYHLRLMKRRGELLQDGTLNTLRRAAFSSLQFSAHRKNLAPSPSSVQIGMFRAVSVASNTVSVLFSERQGIRCSIRPQTQLSYISSKEAPNAPFN